jgi:cytidylate kinase
MKVFVAIDGPAASGKGTIAKILGEELNLPVLYTGNIYRAIAYRIWFEKQDPSDLNAVINSAKKIQLSDLSNPELSQEEVGKIASIIGSYPELREVTYIFQRDFINKSNGAVIEGRDIGTVICPEAKYKFYITADVQVRARRRYEQIKNTDYEKILADLKVRDERDQNRSIAPLKPAQDAIIIDNSKLTPAEVLSEILANIHQN